MKKFKFIFKYFKYLFSAKTAHGIHSPFVYELYYEVINKKGSYYAFDKIELLRRKLLISKKEIDVTDLGAGKSGKRFIYEIAERAAKNSKYGQLLFRITNRFKPDRIIELGTSLGISTAYLASANPHANVITLEGCPNTSAEAKMNFEALGLKNINTIVGNFDNTLPAVLNLLPTTNCLLVFIDGNHKKTPTLNYFKQFLAHANENTILIFDDINWSDEMADAWEEIKKNPAVTITIDLFFLGLVFFRKERAKEHFVIRY